MVTFSFTVLIASTFRVDEFFPALEKGEVKGGMVLIFRYQGPKGAPGMPEVNDIDGIS